MKKQLSLVCVLLIRFSGCFKLSEAQESPAPPTPQTNPSDVQALHELMYAMYYEYDWATLVPDPCVSGPQGIFCEPDATTGILYVTALQFGYLSAIANIIPCSANASIPASVSSLSRLSSLSFTSCFTNQSAPFPSSLPSSLTLLTFFRNPSLQGPIPASIGNLTSLQRLVLSQNSLQGALPAELGNLKSLLQLDLSHNNFTGEVPSSFGNLDSLVNLDLRWNAFRGQLPLSMTQALPRLQRLALSNNKMESLPDSFTGLHSLTFLDLSRNEFVGELPTSIGRLPLLEDLFLNSNRWNGSIPASFGTLSKLVRLDLSTCDLDGGIPSELQLLKELRYLSVSRNKLTGEIPKELASLPVIFTLNLDGNLLSGRVPFAASFVERMGRNLVVKENPGLCYTPSDLLQLDRQCPEDDAHLEPGNSIIAPAPSPSAATGFTSKQSLYLGIPLTSTALILSIL